MKCEYCGKSFSDSVWEIHKEWCKDQHTVKVPDIKNQEDKAEKKEPARGRPRKG